jgi:hypothetical protein
LLAQVEGRIDTFDLEAALADDGSGKPWSEDTRAENAKALWRYEEISDLFRRISIYADGRKVSNDRPVLT